MGDKASVRIGEELERAMNKLGMNAGALANKADKDRAHIEAILAGYPNSERTLLDTVNDVASKVGMRLELVRDV